MATPKEFYSRAVVAYGPAWMKTITSLHVLVVGLRGVGVEFVKCMVMTGVRVITVYDDTVVTDEDLSSCVWFDASDVGKRRSTVVQAIASSKNSHILVRTLTGILTPDLLLNYHLVAYAGCLSREDMIGFNEFCRAQSPPIANIILESRGLLCSLFIDFGASHQSWEDESLEFTVVNVDISTNEVTIRERIVEQLIQVGDIVKFAFCKILESDKSVPWLHDRQYRVLDIVARNTLRVDFGLSTHQISLSEYPRLKLFRVRGMRTITHKSYRESITSTNIMECPYYFNCKDDGRSIQLHCILHGLYTFHNHHGYFPECNNGEHITEAIKHIINFVGLCQQSNTIATSFNLNEDLAWSIVRCISAEFLPLSSVVAGLAAQEAIKFCGLGYPLSQLWYWDAVHVLPNHATLKKEINFTSVHHNEVQMCAIFGKTALERLKNARLALIGCGAVGSEALKNISKLGICSNNPMNCTVVDGSVLKNHDLASHALFDMDCVGEKKCATVNAKLGTCYNSILSKFNPEQTPEIMNEEFWTNLDACVCTVSQPQIAKYLDEKCWIYEKSLLLLDSNALECKLRFVAPDVSERWIARQVNAGSTKHILDEISAYRAKLADNTHILEGNDVLEINRMVLYAKSLFEQYLSKETASLNDYCTSRMLNKSFSANESLLQTIYSTFLRLKGLNSSATSCLDQAYHFLAGVQDTIRLKVQHTKPTHAALIQVTAVLLAQCMQLPVTLDQCVSSYPVWEPPTTSLVISFEDFLSLSAADFKSFLTAIKVPFFNPMDDESHHVLFVQRWCNAVAECYDVQPINFFTCKRFCGCTPQLISCATFMGGLAAMEMIKIILGKFAQVREVNYYPHTALVQFKPPPTPTKLTSLPFEETRGLPLRVCPDQMTLWRKLVIRCTESPRFLLLNDILRYLKVTFEVKVERFKWKEVIIYNMSDAAKLKKSIFQLWEEATQQELQESFLILDFNCKDSDGDVLLPPVQLFQPI